MKQIIFVRHGETDQNITELSLRKANIRHMPGFKEENAPLNSTGIEQAKRTAQELKDTRIDVIFCSSLQRARQTADIINEFHNVSIFEKDNLQERNSGDYVGAAFHELFDFDKNIKSENIESIKEFVDRIYSAMEEILNTDYDNIAIVAHGGVHHAIRTYCLKLPLKGNIRVDKVPNGGIRFYTT
jgi:probable phosphoglycerate mutase